MDILSLAPILLLVVAFYFLLIRPQKNRQKKHAEMVSAVAPGTEVMTTAGIFGTVREVTDEALSLEIAPGPVIRIMPGAVSKVIPPTVSPMDDAE